MRQVLKALASTTVCILVAVGGLGIFTAPVLRFTTGEECWLWLAWVISAASLILAVVVMKIKQVME